MVALAAAVLAERGSAQEPQQVYEKDFGASIVAVAGEAPRIVATQKSVIFLSTSTLSTELDFPLPKGSRIFLSENSDRFALLLAKKITSKTTAALQIYEKNQKIGAASIEDTEIRLSPDGEWLAAFSPTGSNITFYTSTGTKVSASAGSDLRGLDISFSADGEYLIANVPNLQTGHTTGFLLGVERPGNEIWRYNHTTTLGKVASSGDGGVFLFASGEGALLIDRHQNLKHKLSTVAGLAYPALSGDGKTAAIVYQSNCAVEVFSSDTGMSVSSYTIANLDPAASPITSISVTRDGGAVLVTAAKHFSRQNQESYAYLVSPAGHLLWQKTFPEQTLTGKISTDGGRVILWGPTRLYVYKI